MDDARQELNEIDRLLAEALDVDVSPDFAVRLRQRISAQPARAPFWSGWHLLLPAAAAAVVLVVAGMSMRSTRRPAAPPSLSARSLAPEFMRPVDVRQAAPVFASERRQALVHTRVPSGAAVPAVPAEPEVLVPREEIEMYRRLIAEAQKVPGALLVAAPPDIVAVRSISEIPIDPIKIDLIIPSVDGEGDRQ